MRKMSRDGNVVSFENQVRTFNWTMPLIIIIHRIIQFLMYQLYSQILQIHILK